MAEIRKSRRAAFVLLWLATIALVVVWDRSPFAFIVTGIGFIAMLFAFTMRGWWPWTAALGSAGFLANWGLAFADVEASRSMIEVYLSVIRSALDHDVPLDGAIVLSYELVLPLLHVLTFLLLLIGLIRSRRGA